MYLGTETELTLVGDNDTTEQSIKLEQVAGDFPAIIFNFNTTKCARYSREVPRLWLKNGGQIYKDRYYYEYASPECLTVRDAVLYESAGDYIVFPLYQSVSQSGDELLLLKRTTKEKMDFSRGGHENYLIGRHLFDDLVLSVPYSGQDCLFLPDIATANFNLRLLVFILHLITRQIFSGAGHFFCDDSERTRFILSPRVAFLKSIISHDTINNRAIINSRNDSLTNISSKRRLHLIAGDLNRSDYSNYLKLGTTALLLTYLEHVPISCIVRFYNHSVLKHIAEDFEFLYFMRAISDSFNDEMPIFPRYNIPDAMGLALSCQQAIYEELRDNSADILATGEFSETEDVLKMWGSVLDELKNNGDEFQSKLDWMIKRKLIKDAFGIDVSNLNRVSDREIIDNIRLIDFNYHMIEPGGFFESLISDGYIKSMFDERMINLAMRYSPKGRAKSRTEILGYLLGRPDINYLYAGWEKLEIKKGDWEGKWPSIIINLDKDGLEKVKSLLESDN